MPSVRTLFAILALAAAACGPAPAPSPAASPARSEQPRAATVRAGTSGDYPPLSTWPADRDRPDGFAPALLEAFARSSHAEIAWTRYRWPDLARDFEADRFDLAADGITVRPERSVLGRFTVPVARGGAVLLLRRPAWAKDAGNGLGGLDRRELRVVVNRGGHLERVARRLLHQADVRAIEGNQGVREALARGEADAAMTNTFEAPRWKAGLEGVEEIGPLTRDVTALWMRADRPELGDELDAWLLAEEESGRLDALRARWLGPGSGGPTARPVDALLAATAERLALMPFVAAAKKKAGRAVEDTAQEERVLAAARDAVARAARAHGVAPPPAERIDAFFRAQIEAAKAVQEGTAGPEAATFSLDRDLRPAIARITARMAFLLVRVPRGTTREAALARAREDLAETGLPAEHVDRIATALAAFAPN